jgi:hypothetical protein
VFVRLLVLGVLLAAPFMAGCGRDDDRARVAALTERFFSALTSGDGSQACAQLSDATIQQLEQSEHSDCAEAVSKQQLSEGAPRSVQVFAFNSAVVLDNGATVFAERTNDGWRIEAVGCRAAEGPPSENPMDCELES